MSQEKCRDRIKKMQRAVPASAIPASETKYNESNGLKLAELEARWRASRVFTRGLFEDASLPWAGRRASLLYRWRSIFIVEGLSHEVATHATPETHPGLYLDLLCTTAAADHLYKCLGQYKTSASVRKLIRAGTIPPATFITLGRRKMYRFRPLAFEQVCKTLMRGRLV